MKQRIVLCLADLALTGSAFTCMKRVAQAINVMFATANFRGPCDIESATKFLQ